MLDVEYAVVAGITLTAGIVLGVVAMVDAGRNGFGCMSIVGSGL